MAVVTCTRHKSSIPGDKPFLWYGLSWQISAWPCLPHLALWKVWMHFLEDVGSFWATAKRRRIWCCGIWQRREPFTSFKVNQVQCCLPKFKNFLWIATSVVSQILSESPGSVSERQTFGCAPNRSGTHVVSPKRWHCLATRMAWLLCMTPVSLSCIVSSCDKPWVLRIWFYITMPPTYIYIYMLTDYII